MSLPCSSPIHTGSKEGLGAAGEVRKFCHDRALFGFVSQWVKHCFTPTSKLNDQYEGWERDYALRRLFPNTAKHCPVDIFFHDVTSNLEQTLFDKAINIMEGYRKVEERFAPS